MAFVAVLTNASSASPSLLSYCIPFDYPILFDADIVADPNAVSALLESACTLDLACTRGDATACHELGPFAPVECSSPDAKNEK